MRYKVFYTAKEKEKKRKGEVHQFVNDLKNSEGRVYTRNKCSRAVTRVGVQSPPSASAALYSFECIGTHNPLEMLVTRFIFYRYGSEKENYRNAIFYIAKK